MPLLSRYIIGAGQAAGGGARLLTDLANQRLTLTTQIVGGIPNRVVRLGGTEIARPIQAGGSISGYTPGTPK